MKDFNLQVWGDLPSVSNIVLNSKMFIYIHMLDITFSARKGVGERKHS